MSSKELKGQRLLGNCEKGRLFIISAPAGTGKTTLVHMLKEEFPCIRQSISYTTRLPRDGEQDGVDYLFVTREEFEKKIEAGDFLEHVELYGTYYGTSKSWVEKHLSRGEHIILVIDTQGAALLKKRTPHLCSIFILPPSLDELHSRLVKRKTESEEAIEKRFVIAKGEMAKSSEYDYTIINDDLAVAYQVLRSIFIAEEHKTESLNNQT